MNIAQHRRMREHNADVKYVMFYLGLEQTYRLNAPEMVLKMSDWEAGLRDHSLWVPLEEYIESVCRW